MKMNSRNLATFSIAAFFSAFVLGLDARADEAVMQSIGLDDILEEDSVVDESDVAEVETSDVVADDAADEFSLDDFGGEFVDAANGAADAAEAVEKSAADDADAVVEEAADAVIEEAADAVVEETADPVVEEAADPAFDEVTDPVVEETADPVVEEPADPVVEEAADPAFDEVADPVVEETADPVDAVVKDVEDPVTESAEDGAAAVVVDQSISELETLERTRRQLLEDHGRDCLRKGMEMLAVGNWQRAIDSFEEAKKFFPDKANTHEDINTADRGIGEAYYRIALDQVDQMTWDEAEKSCREARAHMHPKAEELLGRIREYRTNPPKPPKKEVLSRSRQPEYKEQRADIAERMKRARQYYATGEYRDCRAILEFILRDYPWTPEAVSMLEKVAAAEEGFAEDERESTRGKMVKDVIDAWTPHTYGTDFADAATEAAATADSNGMTSAGEITAEMRVRDKMSHITIPEIDFRQANITDVMIFLSDASREYDQDDVPPEQKGINFVLDLGSGSADVVAAPVSDDPWGAPAAVDTSASSGGVPPLTIRSRFVSLLSALEMIMEMSDLKYRIQGNVVMIQPKSKAVGALIHRTYNVLPSIGDRAASLGSGSSSGGGDSGDPFAIGTGEVKATSDWKDFFKKFGVEWPDGSEVTYEASIGKLLVKNTADNLASLEQVLAELNVTPSQVEIEVRFVEVSQQDLTSLGLEWLLNDNWELAYHKDDSGLPPASRRRVIMENGSVNSGFDYLSKNSRTYIAGGSAVADNIMKFTSILTNPEVSLVLHALDNRSNSDLLSAPKVVTKTGVPATIKDVVEYIYPTEYEVEMLESSDDDDNTSYTGAVVQPETFVTREVGIVLQVTPRVSNDGSTIDLDLTPSVVSEPTWKNYGSTYPSYTRDEDGNMVYGEVKLMMEQPFFPVRSVATSVSIYNGSTVVMGGMIREERYTEEDKVPILGDIPLLGRLFRYKYEQSVKKNLLIFVSARLVDPAGRQVRGTTNTFVGASN